MTDEVFSIEFPILAEDVFGTITAASCSSNSNYFMSGAMRTTCCCGYGKISE